MGREDAPKADRESQPDGEPLCTSRSRQSQQSRPQQIEMFLDRERPEVAAAESGYGGRNVIAEEQQTGNELHIRRPQAQDGIRRDVCQHGREDAERSADVELGEAEGATCTLLLEQQPRDQEPAQTKKDVDADLPEARHILRVVDGLINGQVLPDVVRDDQRDGNAAPAVQYRNSSHPSFYRAWRIRALNRWSGDERHVHIKRHQHSPIRRAIGDGVAAAFTQALTELGADAAAQSRIRESIVTADSDSTVTLGFGSPVTPFARICPDLQDTPPPNQSGPTSIRVPVNPCHVPTDMISYGCSRQVTVET